MEIKLVDFKNIPLPSTPNFYLICPVEYCQNRKNFASPILTMNLSQLTRRWEQIIRHTPRIKIIYHNPQQQEYTYIQYSRWLCFPDYIYVKLIDLNEEHSSLIIYSRSKYGYGDFGVNKRRILNWIKQLTFAN